MTSHNKIIDLVCPFCSLHCDDVKVSTDGKTFKIHEDRTDRIYYQYKYIYQQLQRRNKYIFVLYNQNDFTL